jgi:WD40 repeat protein
MFYTEGKVCFYIWSFIGSSSNEDNEVKKKPENRSINSIAFHSKKWNWLFVALGNGIIYLYDIGSDFILPEYSRVDPQELLKLEPHLGEIYSIIWTGNESQWVLAGSKSGMVGWKIDEERVLDDDNVYTPVTVDFRMPKHPKGGECWNQKKSVVDSLGVLDDYTVVCKCVTHGFLYVIDLAKTIQELEGFDDKEIKRTEKEARILTKLDWSKTDNFYMNLGCNRHGLVCCGDDQGSLWVYEQPSLVKRDAIEDWKYNEKQSSVIKANVRLMWPKLEDAHLENSGDNPEEEGYDIIVDKVAVSQNSEHIVAVTSNNMVCIWKRQTPIQTTKEESE